jgi:glucosamine--fructose-6-phosphate aminotransferase (isomerizing)
MTVKQEIFEQPEVAQRLLDQETANIQEIAGWLRGSSYQYAFLAARGTSDNAGRYANYLYGAFNRLPVALATPSLFSLYQRPPLLNGALVLGVSQSGQSPDIVSVLEEGRKQGCPTVAITNDVNSPLAKAADRVINVRAGEERAVAATKSYTAQLMAVALLSAALAQDEERLRALQAVPGWMAQALKTADLMHSAAVRYRYMEQCVVLGRGYNYATAFEWSLKLKEMTYIMAEPYSSADFLHGPIAVIERGFPAMAVAPQGAVFPDMLNLLHLLADQHQAELMVISDQAEALRTARTPVELPAGIPEWLTPLISIIPAQLFAYHLTCEKGFDANAPRGLKKVTETR